MRCRVAATAERVRQVDLAVPVQHRALYERPVFGTSLVQRPVKDLLPFIGLFRQLSTVRMYPSTAGDLGDHRRCTAIMDNWQDGLRSYGRPPCFTPYRPARA